MASIYQNSLLTVAATAAADGNGGLFSTRVQSPRIPNQGVYVRRWHRLNANHRMFDQDSGYSRPGLPLLGRAWALQERILAPRVLHYTDVEMIWECNHGLRCECNHNQDFVTHYDVSNGVGDVCRSLKRDYAYTLSSPSNQMETCILWRSIVEEYTKRGLTFDKDKLPALSGVAKTFQPKMGAYFARIWENDLPLGLLWKLPEKEDRGKRASNPILPSWSWASVNEMPVIWQSTCYGWNHKELLTVVAFTDSHFEPKYICQVLNISCSHITENSDHIPK
jgi:hypothetical protein